jgi:N-acetyl-anhydromuramyl-L-alanine amidase AmpD
MRAIARFLVSRLPGRSHNVIMRILGPIVWSQMIGQPPASLPDPWIDPGFNKLIYLQSPNFDARPSESIVDTIVLHSTVEPTLKGTVAHFLRESSQVSAHFTIGKDGSIVQQVSTFDRAWHAGVSRDIEGRERVNAFSVGIELVNLNDGVDPYPEFQMQALENLLAVLIRRFPIKYITSHEYIAQPRGRKSDPAGFPWSRLRRFEPRAKLVFSPTNLLDLVSFPPAGGVHFNDIFL